MKAKPLFCMLLMFLCAQPMCAQKPKLQFLSRTTHDFGIYYDRVPKACVFVVKNTGDAPLVIQSGKADCGCTRVFFTRKPIPPGGKGYIRARYDGNGFLIGRFHKVITIHTNAEPGTHEMTIQGEFSAKNDWDK